jgi:hypothetical protein
MGKRGRPHNRERCLLLFGLHAYADLTFDEIGRGFGISRQAIHQQWNRGRRIIGGIDKDERVALIAHCIKLRHSDVPVIVEFDDPRGKGPYNRQMEWDATRIQKPNSHLGKRR